MITIKKVVHDYHYVHICQKLSCTRCVRQRQQMSLSMMSIYRRNQPMITITHLVLCIRSVLHIISTQLPRVIAQC